MIRKLNASCLVCLVTAVMSLLWLPARDVAAQNPIAESIGASGLTVELNDLAQLPNTKTRGESGGIANTNILVHAGDAANRVYVNDMRGRIYLIEDDVLHTEPFLDITENPDVRLKTNNVFQGFTTFAFHPDFAVRGSNGYGKLYTATDEEPFGTPDAPSSRDRVDQHSVLAEWTIDPTKPNHVDPTSRREILRLAWPNLGHKMDQLAFNPNVSPGDPDYGMLYIALGDGGDTAGSHGQVDVDRNGQNTENLFGTIARIDPFGTNGRNGQYGIPDDNPFVGRPDFQSETWAYGFRNPHRFSWDRMDLGGDGTMYISDIGQASVEEVNIGMPGGNYGWSEREGTFVVDHGNPHNLRPPTTEENASTDFIDPVIQYDHSEGFAIVGGFVMRGPNALDGKYIFGDIRNGRIFAVSTDDITSDGPVATTRIDEILLSHDGEPKTMLELVRETVPDANRVDLRFGQGRNGQLYVLSKQDGYVRRMNLLVTSFPPFDFNTDGSVDVTDIDLLIGEIVADGNSGLFDLSGDGVVDNTDLTQWLSAAANHNGFAGAYLLGDSNLDGLVDATDLNKLALGWQQDNRLWSWGDFTADGNVDAQDLNKLALNWQQSVVAAASSASTVPEPSALVVTCLGLVLAGLKLHR